MLSQLAAGEDSPAAAVAAITLTEPGHEGATYTLTGPAPVTHAQIAAALTDALGREVTGAPGTSGGPSAGSRR